MSTRGEFEPMTSSNPYTPSTIIADAPMPEEYWGTPAGFWIRLAAWVVDLFLFLILLFVLTFVMLLIVHLYSKYGHPLPKNLRQQYVGWGFLLNLSLGGCLYFSLQESSAAQATLGKRLLGLVVIHKQGGRIGFFRAIWRWLAHGFSDALLGIGYLIQPFTQDKQTLHDLFSSTVVIQKARLEQGVKIQPKKYGRPFWFAITINLLFVVAVGFVVGVIAPEYAKSQEKKAKIAAAKNARLNVLAIRYAQGDAKKVALALSEYFKNNEELPTQVDELGIKPHSYVELSIDQSLPGSRALITKEGLFQGRSIWYRVNYNNELECVTDLPPANAPKDCQTKTY